MVIFVLLSPSHPYYAMVMTAHPYPLVATFLGTVQWHFPFSQFCLLTQGMCGNLLSYLS